MKNTQKNMWKKNLTNINDGIFRSINGNSDEMIGVGRCMKAGFPCSRADVTNGRYDAIIDVGNNKLLRIQIKGTSGGSVNFTGGGRSGKQISRDVAQRTYKYTREDCDIILVVDGRNGDCYIIPIDDIEKMGTSKSLSKLEKYRENWDILKKLSGV
ncbi:MAG: hypothetical protein ACD_18C00299G0003 [uncultured bacterium]|nr:MAG: hypothetical protein ACD_18C00299G0003 [uncultured bacterium]OGH89121.1 MAG: hypothetical protein A2507_01395 [Candidatus Magasanikbacteria bacterium RIFOXYD12_FULL_33_17]